MYAIASCMCRSACCLANGDSDVAKGCSGKCASTLAAIRHGSGREARLRTLASVRGGSFRMHCTGIALLAALVLWSTPATGEALLPLASSLALPSPDGGQHPGITSQRHPSAHLRKRTYESHDYYAVQLNDDSVTSPSELAGLLGMTYVGQIGELDHHHLFEVGKGDDPNPSKDLLRERADEIRTRGKRRKRTRRRKRNLESLAPRPDAEEWDHEEVEEEVSPRKMRLLDGLLWSEKQIPRLRVKRAHIPPKPNWYDQSYLRASTTFLERRGIELDTPPQRKINPANITDPEYKNQWHLENRRDPGNDINVVDCWLQGVTGRNVTVALLDDGLDFESLDLKQNFFAAGSYDFNDHTPLPRPILSDDVHGTRCAGEVAAVRDNNVCGVGVAYNARVSGIRILSKEITDADEAMALNWHYHENDIMSCSWGPPDDGASADAPEGIIAKAFLNGIKKGRNGKGTIYVFATGNGGLSHDNCNFDGYTNSVYTLTIGAIDSENRHPYYAEACSAQIAVTYSSGAGSYIHTTDVGTKQCTHTHGGTSAAAPLAAGILALVLEVRPDLNWRDMQYICIRTAEIVTPDDEDWKPTYAGRKFNHKFGYGRLNAYQLVTYARTWKSVKPQTQLRLPIVHLNATIPFGNTGLASSVNVTRDMVAAAGLERLEHVTVTVNLTHALRGDVEVSLISPNMVESRLAERRENDRNSEGLENWTFMSVKHWEEPPEGVWTLHVYDRYNEDKFGVISDWALTLWGEREAPWSDTVDVPPGETSTSSSTSLPSPTFPAASDVPAAAAGGTAVGPIFGAFAAVLALAGAALWAKRRWRDRRMGTRGQDELGFSLLGRSTGDSFAVESTIPLAGVATAARTGSKAHPSTAELLDQHVKPDELFEAFHDEETESESELEVELGGGTSSIGLFGAPFPSPSRESTESQSLPRSSPEHQNFPNADTFLFRIDDDENSP